MKKFVIISDSSMDLPKDVRKTFDIELPIPGKIIYPDGRVEDADSEWDTHNIEKYFENDVRRGVKTSLPNQYEITSRLETYFQQGLDIVAVVLSSGISGTYSAFCTAAEELMQKYKDRKMVVVDTLRYSSAVGLLCIYAALKRNEGLDVDEVKAWLDEQKLSLHQCGVLDDLKFLARNGKITGFKAFMGTMVGVKPIADFSNQTGQPAPLGNVRGYKKAYKVIQEYIARTIGDARQKVVIVEHSMRPQQAEELRKIVEENFHPANIIMCRCGQTNGSAIGPGLATVFYLGTKPISENLVEEVAMFKDIVANV